MTRFSFTLLLLFASRLWAQQSPLDSLTSAIQNHPQQDITRVRMLTAITEFLLEDPSQSKAYIDEAMQLATDLNDDQGRGDSHFALAHLYWNAMDLTQAVEQGLIALTIYERINSLTGLFATYDLLSGLYVGLQDYERANHYMDKALALYASHPHLTNEAEFRINLGFYYLKQKQKKKGIENLLLALEIFQRDGVTSRQATCYVLSGRANQSDKPEVALEYFIKALQLGRVSQYLHYISDAATAHEGIGAIYVGLNQIEKATIHLDSALYWAHHIQSSNIMSKVYVDYITMHEKLGNYKIALQYERLRTALADSLFNSEKEKQLAEAQTRYESIQKENTIRQLEYETQMQKWWQWGLAIVLILSVIVFVVIFLLQRSRSRKAKEVLRVQEQLNHHLKVLDELKSRFFAKYIA